jgi:hypothetical protein
MAQDADSSTSRFSKYRQASDYAPLRKLEVGEEFTERLVGDHEYEGSDGPVPVLDFDEFSWMASSWHAIEQLEIADPQPGDAVRVKRLPNKGRSHQFEIEVIERATPEAVREPEPEPVGAEFGDDAPWE